MHIEAKGQQSASLVGVVTDERAISPSALERSIGNPVIFSKTQAEPQKQVTALPQPLKRFHDLPHENSLPPPNESILKAAVSCPTVCEDGKHASNTQARTLPDTGILSILRDGSTSNVTPGEPDYEYSHINSKLNFVAGSGVTIDNNSQNESASNPQHLESLANNPPSNIAVCFNQQLAQPVVAPPAGVNTVISGLNTEELNSVSAARFCNWTRLNRQPTLKLAQDGLIKIRPGLLSSSPGNLQDFCKFGVYAPPLS